MLARVIDKIVIVIFSLVMQVVLFEKGIDGSAVLAFLFAAIILVVYELGSRLSFVVVTAVLFSAATGLLRISVPISGILAYSLFACVEIKNELKELRFGTRDYIRDGNHIRLLLVTVITCLIAAGEAIKNGAEHGTEAMIFSACLVFLAAFMGIKNSISDGAKEKYYELFDTYRLESRQLKRQRKEAYEKSEENVYMATLKERNRIAREIHDNVGHMLTRAIVQLQALKVINDNDVTKPYIESIDDTVNQAMLNIRKSVHELHDDSVDMSVEIAECLGALPENIKGELKTSIESAVSADIKNLCIAIVREAITNIAKYSSGNKAEVEIIEHSSFWKIRVHDNGKNEVKDYSLDLRDKSAAAGMGLMGIAKRLDKFGGNVNILSDEKGFTVLVTIPK